MKRGLDTITSHVFAPVDIAFPRLSVFPELNGNSRASEDISNNNKSPENISAVNRKNKDIL